MADRLHREDLEAVKAGSPKARLERESVEIVEAGAPKARLERESVEVIKAGAPNVRLQRVGVEAVYNAGAANPTHARLNRADLEIVIGNPQVFSPCPDASFPCNTFCVGGPVGYYLSLLTSEYQSSPNLKAWLSSVLIIISDIMACLCTMNSAFDIDSAVGVQLDTIGLIIGANRTVGFQPSGGVSPTLDDGTYRIYLKAKVAQNQWNGQADSLYAIWSNLFPGGLINIIDNQNMTATIVLAGAFSSIVQDLILNGYIVPRPETVQYNYVFPALPMFGYDANNSFIAGYDAGKYV